jgi:hypothetical protein
MLKVMESTSVPALSSVLPAMFGLLIARLSDNANAVAVIDDEVRRVKVTTILTMLSKLKYIYIHLISYNYAYVITVARLA